MELPNLLTLILIYRYVIRSLSSENNIMIMRYELEFPETSKDEPRCMGISKLKIACPRQI